MAVKQRVVVPISLSLRQETLERLTASVTDVSPSDALGARASAYLENLADGGMALTPDQVTQVEAVYKKPIRNGNDVVAAVQKSSGFEDGVVFPNRLDPSFMPPLEERAREVGRPVSELLSDMIEYALENDWLLGIQFEGKRRTFSPANEAYLTAELGENFTVDQLVTAFKQLKRKGKKVEEPELVEA